MRSVEGRKKCQREGRKIKIKRIKGSFLISLSKELLRLPPGALGLMGKGHTGQPQLKEENTLALFQNLVTFSNIGECLLKLHFYSR